MNQSEAQDPEPDLTPLLDVVFIMLIFFIVTATFVKEIGIDLPSDDRKPETISAEKSLVVEIEKDNRFLVNKKHIDRRTLIPYLSALHAENPDASLVIVPHMSSDTDALVFVLDAGELLNIKTSISIDSD